MKEKYNSHKHEKSAVSLAMKGMQIITITIHFLPRQLADIFKIVVLIRMRGIQ